MSSIDTLHILNKPPEHPRFQRCMRAAGPRDAVLLIESAVLSLSQATNHSQRILALTPDLRARGIAPDCVSAETVDYDGMVNLTIDAQQVISW